MPESPLWRQATQFRKRMAEIKSGICLRVGRWYPYESMGSLRFLDEFLSGDVQALRALAGDDPVLDIGCGDGELSFFFESLGCTVRAIDHPPTNNNAMFGVHVLRQALGSPLEIQAADIDRHLPLPEPHYGLALLLGVLYHLKNPYQVLETLAKKSRYCFLSTRVAALAPDKTRIADLPVAYLLDEAEVNDDDSNFWIFSEAGLRRILKRTGWTVRNWQTNGDPSRSDPLTDAGDARVFCLLESRLVNRPESFALARGWHELEFDAWRWTERRFSVRLSSPLDDQPATLRFRFHVPPPLAAERPSLALSVAVNGTTLPPRICAGGGEHQYVASVPASAFTPGNVIVDFELDGALGPTDRDQRELGLLVDFTGTPPIVLE